MKYTQKQLDEIENSSIFNEDDYWEWLNHYRLSKKNISQSNTENNLEVRR